MRERHKQKERWHITIELLQEFKLREKQQKERIEILDFGPQCCEFMAMALIKKGSLASGFGRRARRGKQHNKQWTHINLISNNVWFYLWTHFCTQKFRTEAESVRCSVFRKVKNYGRKLNLTISSPMNKRDAIKYWKKLRLCTSVIRLRSSVDTNKQFISRADFNTISRERMRKFLCHIATTWFISHE